MALTRKAILVTPDYRLLPESNGLDILSDLDDFWAWMQNDLASTIASAQPTSSIQPDLSKILVAGESAGGYLAAQSMLLHPEIHMSAVILVYPMVHLRDRFWDEKYEKPMYGESVVSAAWQRLRILAGILNVHHPSVHMSQSSNTYAPYPMGRSSAMIRTLIGV